MMSKNAFHPAAVIEDYLAGKLVSTQERLIIRKALTQLLLLSWRSAFTALPELAIAKETPLMEMPYLSDTEKHWMEERIPWPLRATIVKAGEIDYSLKCYIKEASSVRDFTVNFGLKGLSPCLFSYAEGRKPILPCDYRTLRICTLLYRPQQQWSREEFAIMREGGIKVAPKQREQKIFRTR